jgi:hypothetical protein
MRSLAPSRTVGLSRMKSFLLLAVGAAARAALAGRKRSRNAASSLRWRAASTAPIRLTFDDLFVNEPEIGR